MGVAVGYRSSLEGIQLFSFSAIGKESINSTCRGAAIAAPPVYKELTPTGSGINRGQNTWFLLINYRIKFCAAFSAAVWSVPSAACGVCQLILTRAVLFLFWQFNTLSQTVDT